MRLAVVCPLCGKQGSIRQSLAGRKIKCRSCGGTFFAVVDATLKKSTSPELPHRSDSPALRPNVIQGATGGGRFKEMARNTWVFVLYVYWIGIMISIPYYNWKYARENGFWSWLVLGQIVPTLQSAIWPYYVVSSLFERGWTQQEMENLAHLKRSGTAYVKAKIFFEGFEKTGKAPPAEAAKAVELLNEALTESKLVSDDVLPKLHKDLPNIYRQKYVTGLKHLVHVLEGGIDNGGKLDEQEFETANGLLTGLTQKMSFIRCIQRRLESSPQKLTLNRPIRRV